MLDADCCGRRNDSYQCDCVEELGVEDVEMAREELYVKAPDRKTRSLWRRVFRTIFVKEIVLKNLRLKTWKWLGKSCI